MEKYMEKYIAVIFIGIISIFVLNYFYKINTNIESFTNPENIILLGDSILKNNSYVVEGQSVQDILASKTDANVYCFAVNDSTIKDAYSQINLLPQHLNEPSTILFLSIGGNDILKRSAEGSLSSIFIEYIELIELIKERMNMAKIVMINLYYPTDERYEKYYPLIKKWNEMVDAYSQDEHIYLLNSSTILIEALDFTSEIEPSAIGGEKLANAIASISI